MADETNKPDDALAEMRTRYKLASDGCREAYDRARDDIKFIAVPGNQWDESLKKRRGNMPCYEFPKLRGHALQVINEIRQARPQGKVRGVGEDDQSLAEIMQGLIRNVESTSNAETAYDIGSESAVYGGLGWWRICTDYLSDDDLEQDIRVKPIRNFASVKDDPAATEIDRRDSRFRFIDELIPRSQFEADYPEASLTDFDADDGCRLDWREKDQVRIAEYWYKEPVKREVLALSDGEMVNADELPKGEGGPVLPPGVTVVNSRTVKGHKVLMRLTNGHEWLTEPYEFPSKFIPQVPVWGNIINVDGEDYWCGLIRFAKDLQRLHNTHRTATIEAIAKAPKAPFILKLKWIKGLTRYWDRSNAEDFPYLPVADDADGMPTRTEQAQFPAALVQIAAIENDDMKAATGQFDASLGNRSNETSGIAINSRKQQGATATFNFPDNLAKAIQFTYEIIGDMLPRVIDTPRAVRILGEDGGAKFKQLYKEVIDPQTGARVVLNDIGKGKYDYTVTVGPSYATQRMEAADAYANMAGQIGSAHPAIAALMAYGVVKNQDVSGIEEVETALRKQLVNQGLLPPKEGEQPPAPPPPDPRAEADARKLHAQAAESEARAHKVQAETQLTAAQVEKLVQDTVALALQNAGMGATQVFGPPPDPYGPMRAQAQFAPQPDQPPQGGFSLPGNGAAPPPDPAFTDPFTGGY